MRSPIGFTGLHAIAFAGAFWFVWRRYKKAQSNERNIANQLGEDNSSTLDSQPNVAAAQANQPDAAAMEEKVTSILKSSRVVLFMKGTRETPRCKFSRSILELLNSIEDVHYATFDVLSDEAIRAAIKIKLNWPTFPILVVNDRLVGGLDICKELHESGELSSMLREVS
mmetsp:Transcript_41593/g.67486  ORF Transcript_41593/g.67486 Transcript_41593/m.67486 type:complete len:169 (-) Transcript_41593:374-880(-)